MSTHPRLEARVSALERRQINLEARVEEVTEDITTSIKQSSRDMTASFKQLDEYLIKTETLDEERFNKIEADIADVKTMLNQHTTRFNNLEALLTQVLERLPKNENK